MEIISFDVGIKNLAYCYVNITDKKLNIKSWNIINLLEEKKCFYDKCKKKPTYCTKDKIKQKYYMCDKHKLSDKFIKRYIADTCKTVKIDILKLELIKQLDYKLLPILLKNMIKYVLIENQPTYKNPKMKAISDTLYCWFLIRGIHDFKAVSNVKYIAPLNKLRVFSDNSLTNIKYDYKTNKNAAIEITTKMISDKWKSFLSTNKKKDDLADSFLQLIYFMKRNLRINIHQCQ